MNAEKENLLEEAYKMYLDLMLHDFPVSQIDELATSDVMGYGTTLDEKILDIKRLSKLVMDQREQAIGIEIHFDINQVHRRISPSEDMAIFVDEIEITMFIDGDKNVIPLRLGTVFEFIGDQWKVVHLHGSKAVEIEGNTWHKEEWKKKNEELQKLVDEKTADLIEKNQELEIEAALEKVRSIAMGMKESADMLEVCKAISRQLELLGVKEIRNVQTAIFYQERGNYMNYQYYTKHEKTIITETTYTNNEIHNEFALKMLKGKGESFITHIKGKEVKDWIVYQKTTNVFIDKYLETASSLNYYWFSLGPVALGMSTYHPITEEEINLFKRFLKVFELAYRRYLDIEKAEAQAREALIEVALEKIRSLALGMRKSEEVGNVTDSLFAELNNLSVNVVGCSIVVINKEEDIMETWRARSDVAVKAFESTSFIRSMDTLKKNLPTWYDEYISALESKEDILINEFKQGDRPQFLDTVAEQYNYTSEERLKLKKIMPQKIVAQLIFSKLGYLALISEKKLSDENLAIARRFIEVFDFAYTRFLDIKKAEAQAREAIIEAALERVRSRTMGMQKSEELKEVIQLVYEQLVHLNINVEHTGFIMDYKARDDLHIWLADQNEIPSEVTIPCFDSLPNNNIREAKEKGKDFFEYLLTFEEKNKFYKELFKFIPGVPKESLEYYFNCRGLAGSGVLLENIGLYIENFSGIPYKDEENKTLMRFGKVFQQTYTRFLDLQKAEAQAREAQIEAALERVRNRTMAMQHSDELAETSGVLFEQFVLLGIDPKRCVIGIIDQTKESAKLWFTSSDGKVIPGADLVPLNEQENLIDLYQAWKHYEQYFYFKVQGKKRLEWTSYMVDKVGMHLPEYQPDTINKNLISNEPAVFNCFFFTHGFIMLHTVEEVSESEIPMLKRFAGVFEQTYTRFLDLKNAEAQAREAQIEASLEKVRARAMAMHSSEDLSNTVNVFFKELKSLGIIPIRCGVGQIDEETRTTNLTTTTASQQGESFKVIGKVKQTGHPVLDGIFDNWKLQKEYHPVLQGDDIKVYYSVMNSQIDYPEYREDVTQYGNTFYFKEGFVFAWTENELSEEELKIFRRFTSVISLTYRRYIDLKEAEAQAREAQIESSLERVRAVAMSMNKSDDLLSICEISFKEFKKLGFDNIRNTIIHILNDEKGFFVDYDYSDYLGGSINNINYNAHPIVEDYLRQIKKADDAFAEVVIEGKQLDSWKDFRRRGGQHDDPRLDNIQALYYYMYSIGVGDIGISAFNPINEDEFEIIKRFRNVFNLAYRRYNDIALAEAQAREAQIEAAIEKVRARTMAMQRSDELAETAAIVFKQLIILGIEPNRLYIAIIKDEIGNAEFWITDEDGSKVSSKFIADMRLNKSFQKMYEGWKEQKKSITLDMRGKELEEYFKHLTEIKVPFKGGLSQKRRVQNIAYFSRGFMGIASPDSLPEETADLLNRFAAVFNLTYTRFNDLQQAEAQNKIIQAENERKTKELEEARLLQLAMLPKELPQLPNLDIAVFMQTATEVGGDYYDFKVGYDGTLTTIIGDATGHGMKAGTVVTITKSLFNSMEMHENILGAFDKISQVIKGMKFRQLAMCLLMMKIKGNRLSISSAAMPPALIYRANNKKVEELLLKGMPLGTMSKFPYKKIEGHLNSGDTILLSSDGLPELANDKGDMFGYEKIKTEFQSIGEKEPEEIVEYFKNSASQWANGKEPDDDVTIVVIKIK